MTKLTDEAVKALLEGTTPGPWQSFRDWLMGDRGAVSMVDAVIARDQPKFEIIPWTGFDGSDAPKEDQPHNARLIAAAPDLARQLLATMDALAEAQAAQAEAAMAAVVERAENRLSDLIFWTGDDDNGTTLVSLREAKAALRALAPASGFAMLAELRAERDKWKAVSETLSEMSGNAEAECLRLAAALATQEAGNG